MFATYSQAAVNKAPVPFNKIPARKIPVQSGTDGAAAFALAHAWPETAADGVLGPLALAAAIVQFDRDAEIIAQGEQAEYCFQVVSGCVRTVRLLEDGRRQVGEFLFRGDIFGWDTVGEHEFAAEAVTPTSLRRVRLTAIEARADQDRAFAQSLRRYSADQVRLARGRLVLLGRKTASERIASFLLEMAERLRCTGNAVIDLPMSRADMADYLGLTIETVCRGLTELRRHGTIAVERTRIVIQDRHALALAGSDWMH